MTDPLAARALFALYRNHPETPPGARYGWRAKGNARARRSELLAWAATQSDDRLLSCRNLGATSLEWIRLHQPLVSDSHDYDDAQKAWVRRASDHDDREAFMAGWDAALAAVLRIVRGEPT